MLSTRTPFFFVSLLACVGALGCPSRQPSTTPNADTDPEAGSDSTGADTSGGQLGDGSSDSDGGGEAATCPIVGSLTVEELLAGPAPGGVVVDGETTSVSEVDFGEVDGSLAVVASAGEDLLIIPLDETGEAPSGAAVWVTPEGVYEGSAEFVFDDEAQSVSLRPAVLTAADGSTRSVSACVVLGAGSSRFALDGEVATLTGTLGSVTYTQVEAIIAEHPEIRGLVLADVPGSINDEVNVETGRLVRSAGWSTAVPADGVIASGGVDLFVAGQTRSVEPGAQLGVHSWSDGVMDGADYPRDDPAHAMQLSYVTEMLGDPTGPEFYWFTLEAAPAAGIHWMTAEEIDRYALVTR